MSTAQTQLGDRVDRLVADMTLEEKLAQLVGYWVDQGDEVVAPMAGEMATVDELRGCDRARHRPSDAGVRDSSRRSGGAGRVAVGGAAPSAGRRPGSASRRSCTRSA